MLGWEREKSIPQVYVRDSHMTRTPFLNKQDNSLLCFMGLEINKWQCEISISFY